jgi:hypothetical protein
VQNVPKKIAAMHANYVFLGSFGRFRQGQRVTTTNHDYFIYILLVHRTAAVENKLQSLGQIKRQATTTQFDAARRQTAALMSVHVSDFHRMKHTGVPVVRSSAFSELKIG